MSCSRFSFSPRSFALLVAPTIALAGIGAAPPALWAQQQTAPPPVPVGTEQKENGELFFSVVIVDDLTPRPVPLTDFKITAAPVVDAPAGAGQQQAATVARTDEQGELRLALPAGQYTVESAKPLEYKGKTFTWKASFTIETGKTARVKLTDADAVKSDAPVAAAPKPGARQISDEAKIYQVAKNGVVTVEGDMGHGSGFVVDAVNGLVITNEHVVNDGRWVALRFDKGVRVPAVLVARDPLADIAVVRFNPASVPAKADGTPSFSALTMATPPAASGDAAATGAAPSGAASLAVEGEKVLAIGSPLRQEKILTTGIISKVETDVFLSDVNINSGNSGGPLLNLAGEVIGVNTFRDGGARGPGVSGIVAVTKAAPVLAEARAKLGQTPLPSASLLPDIATTPIPAEAINDAILKDRKPYRAGAAPKNFTAQLYTPFTMASAQGRLEREMSKQKTRRVNKRDQKGVKDGYNYSANPFWARYALDIQDPIVTIQVFPMLRETSGSQWSGFFGAVLGVQTTKKMEFRDDFYDMQLFRGDEAVLPVRRYRAPVEYMYEGWALEIKDTAFGGVYCFDPSAFAPGAPITLKMRRESNIEKWDSFKIDRKTQEAIWKEFEPYRAATVTGGGK